jgi:hypothetical protein
VRFFGKGSSSRGTFGWARVEDLGTRFHILASKVSRPEMQLALREMDSALVGASHRMLFASLVKKVDALPRYVSSPARAALFSLFGRRGSVCL